VGLVVAIVVVLVAVVLDFWVEELQVQKALGLVQVLTVKAVVAVQMGNHLMAQAM
jgi:hypothetical protein